MLQRPSFVSDLHVHLANGREMAVCVCACVCTGGAGKAFNWELINDHVNICHITLKKMKRALGREGRGQRAKGGSFSMTSGQSVHATSSR